MYGNRPVLHYIKTNCAAIKDSRGTISFDKKRALFSKLSTFNGFTALISCVFALNTKTVLQAEFHVMSKASKQAQYGA